MPIILLSVVLEVTLFSFRDAFVHFLMEYMNVGFIGANSIFVVACISIAAPAFYYYRSEFLGWFKRTPSVPGIPETNKAQTQPTITQPHSLPVSDLPKTDVIQFQSPTDEVETLWTLDEILKSVEDCTNMQIADITRPHMGKWLKVNEIVGNVYEHKDTVSVSLGKDLQRNIFMAFDKKRWIARLETMKIGDRLFAKGKIEQIQKYRIWLEDCKVIDIKPRESSSSNNVNSNVETSKDDER